MKLLATAIFSGMMIFGTAACAKEDPKKEVPAEVKKDAAAPAPETKRVCLDVQGKDGKPVIDPKTNKPRQNCTTVKVRPKFEGTAIDSAPKK
jgi:hypothetical protein